MSITCWYSPLAPGILPIFEIPKEYSPAKGLLQMLAKREPATRMEYDLQKKGHIPPFMAALVNSAPSRFLVQENAFTGVGVLSFEKKWAKDVLDGIRLTYFEGNPIQVWFRIPPTFVPDSPTSYTGHCLMVAAVWNGPDPIPYQHPVCWNSLRQVCRFPLIT